jgi:hypothetical protein
MKTNKLAAFVACVVCSCACIITHHPQAADTFGLGALLVALLA